MHCILDLYICALRFNGSKATEKRLITTSIQFIGRYVNDVAVNGLCFCYCYVSEYSTASRVIEKRTEREVQVKALTWKWQSINNNNSFNRDHWLRMNGIFWKIISVIFAKFPFKSRNMARVLALRHWLFHIAHRDENNADSTESLHEHTHAFIFNLLPKWALFMHHSCVIVSAFTAVWLPLAMWELLDDFNYL